MSVQAMSWVIENSKHQGSAFVVLLMIANRAHPDGSNAYATIGKIAKDARLGKRQVYNILPKLEASGELFIDRSAGRNPHRYTVTMGANGANIAPLNGAISDPSTVQKIRSTVQNNRSTVQFEACHIRNRTHEPMNPKRGEQNPPSVSPSAVNGNGTHGNLSAAYRKLAAAVGVALPATAREDKSLRAAESDLQLKMQPHNEGQPVSDRQTCQAIETILRYWYADDWRGKKGEAPTPAQISESYGAAIIWLNRAS